MKPHQHRSALAGEAKVILRSAGVALALAVSAQAAHAQDYRPQAGNVVVRVGGAGVLFDSGAKINLAGQPLAGASVKVKDNVTPAAELGYYVRPDVSLTLTVGFPPKTGVDGVGVLAPAGRLGSVRYGPMAALAKYHFYGLGRFQPWVGGGATYMIVFSDTDAALQNVEVDSHWGGVVQAGADYMMGPRWGLYASLTQMFLHTNGRASFNTLPITAKIDLDPRIVQGGVTFRF